MTCIDFAYLCHRKQGEKIDCYIPYCTSNFGVQGGRDATLFFFYVSEVPQLAAAIYQNALQSSAFVKGDGYGTLLVDWTDGKTKAPLVLKPDANLKITIITHVEGITTAWSGVF